MRQAFAWFFVDDKPITFFMNNYYASSNSDERKDLIRNLKDQITLDQKIDLLLQFGLSNDFFSALLEDGEDYTMKNFLEVYSERAVALEKFPKQKEVCINFIAAKLNEYMKEDELIKKLGSVDEVLHRDLLVDMLKKEKHTVYTMAEHLLSSPSHDSFGAYVSFLTRTDASYWSAFSECRRRDEFAIGKIVYHMHILGKVREDWSFLLTSDAYKYIMNWFLDRLLDRSTGVFKALVRKIDLHRNDDIGIYACHFLAEQEGSDKLSKLIAKIYPERSKDSKQKSYVAQYVDEGNVAKVNKHNLYDHFRNGNYTATIFSNFSVDNLFKKKEAGEIEHNSVFVGATGQAFSKLLQIASADDKNLILRCLENVISVFNKQDKKYAIALNTSFIRFLTRDEDPILKYCKSYATIR